MIPKDAAERVGAMVTKITEINQRNRGTRFPRISISVDRDIYIKCWTFEDWFPLEHLDDAEKHLETVIKSAETLTYRRGRIWIYLESFVSSIENAGAIRFEDPKAKKGLLEALYQDAQWHVRDDDLFEFKTEGDGHGEQS